MSNLPLPLPPATLLDERFELGAVLGQGGFGITYQAYHIKSREAVVIKELAPDGSQRQGTQLVFPGIGPAAMQRLRAQFDQEGRLIQKLRIPGLVHGTEIFQENSTSYLVMEQIVGAVSLEKLARSEGRMEVAAVLGLVEQVLVILSELHGRGILHRDLKPSNMLLDPEGHVWLIDLGSAREWVADLTVRHTVLYTPGFAPLEQLSENARRGPGTDLYGLAATAYFLLTGLPPATPGEELVSIRQHRPDVPSAVASALEAALALRLEERPASAGAMRAMLDASSGTPEHLSWEILDARLAKLRSLHPGRFECPGCGDVLQKLKPAKPGTCIVCREGRIVARELDTETCPCCGVGLLRPIDNREPLHLSPNAPTAALRGPSGIVLPWQNKVFHCTETGDDFTETRTGVVRTSDGLAKSWAEWRELSGRSEKVWQCEACHAQYDEEADGRRRQITPEPLAGDWLRLFPEEWARIAKGLDPGAGNAICERCAAEYFAESQHLTLLDAHRDPYEALATNQGRLITLEQTKWLAAGKSSGNAGLSCAGCRTEFDDGEDQEMVLVATSTDALEPCVGQSATLADWHRFAHGLPRVGEEQELEDTLDHSIRDAYANGEFVSEPYWKSGAHLDGAKGNLTCHQGDLEWATLLKKRRLEPTSMIVESNTELSLQCDETTFKLEIQPMVISLPLASGKRAFAFDAYDLAERFNHENQ